jgi:acetyl-CoA acetyltransferase
MITPTRSLLHEISIVGVGRTEMARRLEMSTLSACLEAAKHALADAGLRVQDVDGISARWPGPGGTVFLPSSSDWSKLLGVPLRWVGDTYPQGVPAALEAAAAIVTGQCETVLVVYASRQRVPLVLGIDHAGPVRTCCSGLLRPIPTRSNSLGRARGNDPQRWF